MDFFFRLVWNNLFSQLVFCGLHKIHNCNQATHTHKARKPGPTDKKRQPLAQAEYSECRPHISFSLSLFSFSYWFSTTCNIMSWNKKIKTLSPKHIAFYITEKQSVKKNLNCQCLNTIFQTEENAYRNFLLRHLQLELTGWLLGSYLIQEVYTITVIF